MVKISTKLIVLSAAVLLILSVLAIAINLTDQITDGILLAFSAVIILIVLIASIFMVKSKHRGVKLIVLGMAMVLLGATAWLWGWDANSIVWSWLGILGVVLGAVVWTVADDLSGAFDERVATLMDPVKGIDRKRMNK